MRKLIQIFVILTLTLFTVGIGNAAIFVATTSANNCVNCDGNALLTTDTPGAITYEWFSLDGTSIFTETNGTGNSAVANLCAGIYYVVTTYTNSPIDSITYFNIATTNTQNISFSEMITCSNSTIDLNDLITPGVSTSGNWTLPDGTVFDGNLQGSENSPLSSGVYQYTLQEGNCDVSSGVYLTANDPANPGLSTTYLICENYPPFLMTDFLSGSPDYGGDWYDSNNSLTSETFDTQIQDTEIFTYLIDTVEGCSPVFSTLYVIENLLPNSGLPNEITICETAPSLDLFPLLGGAPETTGVWFDDNFQNISMPFVPSENEAGVYTYMVAGDVPCPSSQTDISINYTPGAYAGNANNTTVCEGSPDYNLFESLSGTVTPGGEWTNQNNTVIDSIISTTNANTGTYTYSVSLAGCSDASSTFVFAVESEISAGNDNSITLCETENNYNLYNALSPEANLDGTWLENNDSVNYFQENLGLGMHEFIYQTNAIGCPIDEAIISLEVVASLTAGNDSTITLCQSDTTVSLFNFLSGQSNNSGVWDYNNTPVSDNFSPNISSEGIYTYTLDPANACQADESNITVTVIDSISFPENITLENCNYGQLIEVGETNEVNCTYQWSPQTYLSSATVSNPTIDLSALPPSLDLAYEITINNEACQKIVQRNVSIHETPLITIDSLYTGCQGDIVTLNSGDFEEVSWSPLTIFANPTNQNQSLTLENSGIITLTVMNSYNCMDTKEIELEVLPSPNVSYEINDQFHCTPATVVITNTSFNTIPTNYSWSFSNNHISNEEVVIQTFDTPTSFNFSLTATADNGCTRSVEQNQNIEVIIKPQAIFSFETQGVSIFNNELEMSNNSHNSSDFIWTLNDLNFSTEEEPIATLPQVAGLNHLICLEAFNNYCSDTTCKSIYIPEEQNIYVPNAFTPNDDQVNDVFQPVLMQDNILEYSLTIYNQWGVIVFQSQDMDEGWVGDTYDNHEYYAKNGIYIWQLKIKEKDIRGEQIFRGTVSLIR